MSAIEIFHQFASPEAKMLVGDPWLVVEPSVIE
jgi:hypothetical protein